MKKTILLFLVLFSVTAQAQFINIDKFNRKILPKDIDTTLISSKAALNGLKISIIGSQQQIATAVSNLNAEQSARINQIAAQQTLITTLQNNATALQLLLTSTQGQVTAQATQITNQGNLIGTQQTTLINQNDLLAKYRARMDSLSLPLSGFYKARSISAPTTILNTDRVIQITSGTFTQPVPTGLYFEVYNTGPGVITFTLNGVTTATLGKNSTLQFTWSPDTNSYLIK